MIQPTTSQLLSLKLSDENVTMNKLLILTYHAILSDDTDELKDGFSLKFSHFVEQLNWIEKSKIPIVDLATWCENNGKSNELSIALTFDDGFVSDYELAVPELMKRKIPATFFPIVSKIGESGFLNWSQLKEMRDNNFEIGSHGISHSRLTSFSEEKLIEEIVHSKKILEEKLNHSVRIFSLPYGVYTSKTLEKIFPHFSFVLTTRAKINDGHSNGLLHRFNCKNTQTFQQFQDIIQGKKQTLYKRKWISSLAWRWNQIKGFSDSLVNKNQ